MSNTFEYSEKYEDDEFEYRHVIIPDRQRQQLPNPLRLLTEPEWRGMF